MQLMQLPIMAGASYTVGCPCDSPEEGVIRHNARFITPTELKTVIVRLRNRLSTTARWLWTCSRIEPGPGATVEPDAVQMQTTQRTMSAHYHVQNRFLPGGVPPGCPGDAASRSSTGFGALNHVVLPWIAASAGTAPLPTSHPGRLRFKANHAYGQQTLWPDHCVQGHRTGRFIRCCKTDRRSW